MALELREVTAKEANPELVDMGRLLFSPYTSEEVKAADRANSFVRAGSLAARRAPPAKAKVFQRGSS